MAFLPQFIYRTASSVASATILLGCIFDTGGTLVNLVVALVASYSANQLIGRFLQAGAFRWLSGTVFLGLGLRLAFSGNAQTK